MSGGFTLTYTNQAGNRRRIRFERRSPGGWDRIVEELSGGEWRQVGEEIVADLEVDIDATVVDAVDVIPASGGGGGEVIQGP